MVQGDRVRASPRNWLQGRETMMAGSWLASIAERDTSTLLTATRVEQRVGTNHHIVRQWLRLRRDGYLDAIRIGISWISSRKKHRYSEARPFGAPYHGAVHILERRREVTGCDALARFRNRRAGTAPVSAREDVHARRGTLEFRLVRCAIKAFGGRTGFGRRRAREDAQCRGLNGRSPRHPGMKKNEEHRRTLAARKTRCNLRRQSGRRAK